MHEQKFKDPLKVANAHLAQKDECWTWNMRGPSSIPTGGNILPLDVFVFM